jgi:23S rRNA pseudouridine2604 synthase
MRLNKHISDSGFCSRREADGLIAEGRVTVNAMRARIGAEVGEGDEVKVDGQALRARTAAKGQRKHVYIALNKPVGITSTKTTSSISSGIRSGSFRSDASTRIPKA